MSYNRAVTISCDTNTNSDCTVEAALAILSGKWKLKIFKAIQIQGASRFTEIRNAIEHISEKTLTAQLREMEADGLLSRMVYPEVPPKVEYRLTQLGESVEAVFKALDSLGKNYIQSREPKP